jgi:hypothetical protein
MHTRAADMRIRFDISRFFAAFTALGLILALGAAGTARAATVFNDRIAFLDELSSPFIDDYQDLSLGRIAGPLDRGPYSVDASVGDLFAVMPDTIALSTAVETASLVLTITNPSINALGGNFFPTDFSGGFQAGNVTLTLADGTVLNFVVTASGSNPAPFIGIIADQPITSARLTASQGLGDAWPTIDDLVLAPEPSSGLLFAFGLVAFAAGRRASPSTNKASRDREASTTPRK